MPGTTFPRTAASIAFWIEDTSPAKLLAPGVEAAAGAEPLEEELGPVAVSSEPRGCEPRGLSPVHATTVRLSASKPAPRPRRPGQEDRFGPRPVSTIFEGPPKAPRRTSPGLSRGSG